jgi:UDP-N-acetylmuramate--alanine ligase
VICANDRGAARLGQIAKQRGQKVCTYGIRDSKNGSSNGLPDYIADSISFNPSGGMSFTASCSITGSNFELNHPINLQMPGRHNVLNALAALGVAHLMQLPVERAGKALSAFRGTGRRFEVRGEVSGITVIDDYAHHPTEIKATIAAARMRYHASQLWVVWQPHTYSRTRLLLNDFASAFEQADHVVVTEIYAARETQPEDGFSSKQIVATMKQPDARYMTDFSQITSYLVERMQRGDVLLVLSAGDADQISARVEALLKERRARRE